MTEVLPDARFNFVFAAPDEMPSWDLSLDALVDHVLGVDPEAVIRREYDSGGFDATFPFGPLWGVMDSASVGLRLANVPMAAAFAVWLRTSVLPASTGIAFMTHEAIELGQQPCALPETDDLDVVEAAMLPYLRAVVETYNS